MASNKRLYNETNNWEYVLIKLKCITCFVLSLLLFFAAYIMLKCSTLFETLSEYLKPNINTEDLSEGPFVRCDCSFNRNNKSNISLDEDKVVVDTIKETSSIKCNDNANMELNIYHKLREENINNISDSVNEILNLKLDGDNNKNELQSQVLKVITGKVKETSTNKQYNDNTYIEHDLQEKIIYISDTENETSNIKCNDNANMEHNIQHELQEANINNISNTVNETLNKKYNYNVNTEYNIQYELQEENSNDVSNSLNELLNIKLDGGNKNELQLNVLKVITGNKKETPNNKLFIDNSYIEHTIQHELQNEISIISDTENETSNINDNINIEYNIQYELQEENINNISDSVNEVLNIKLDGDNNKNELQLNVLKVITSNEKETFTNKQCNDNTYIEHELPEKIIYISDTENETSNIKCNDNVNMEHNIKHELQEANINISNTVNETLHLNQNCPTYKDTMDEKIITPDAIKGGNRFSPRTMSMIVNTIKDNDGKGFSKTNWKIIRDLDKTPRTSTETINPGSPHLINESISKSTSVDLCIEKELLIKETISENDSYEQPYDNDSKDTSYKNTNNHNYANQNNNSCESGTSMNKYESSNLIEVDKDIFSLGPEYSLAHCVFDSFSSIDSICTDFKIKFGGIDELLDQHLGIGDVGEIVRDNQYIFYLITKRFSKGRPSNTQSLERALNNLLLKMKKHGLTKLAIPSYGLNLHYLDEEKHTISKVFSKTNIEIILCMVPSKLQITRPIPSKVLYTSKQLWEMEPQTDILMFIDMGKMYLENWKDEVVENINARYQFKDRFLKDINIKPMAPGDVWSYKIGIELLFCIFIKPEHQNPSYFRCLNKAFNMIKSEVTGYRYLGIQLEQPALLDRNSITSRTLIMLQSVFSQASAEIWLCGDNKHINTHKYQQYRKTVDTAIEMNKGKSFPNNRYRNKYDRSRHGLNIVTKTHGSVGNNHKPDNIEQKPKYLDQSLHDATDHCMTDNWDDY